MAETETLISQLENMTVLELNDSSRSSKSAGESARQRRWQSPPVAQPVVPPRPPWKRSKPSSTWC